LGPLSNDSLLNFGFFTPTRYRHQTERPTQQNLLSEKNALSREFMTSEPSQFGDEFRLPWRVIHTISWGKQHM